MEEQLAAAWARCTPVFFCCLLSELCIPRQRRGVAATCEANKGQYWELQGQSSLGDSFLPPSPAQLPLLCFHGVWDPAGPGPKGAAAGKSGPKAGAGERQGPAGTPAASTQRSPPHRPQRGLWPARSRSSHRCSSCGLLLEADAAIPRLESSTAGRNRPQVSPEPQPASKKKTRNLSKRRKRWTESCTAQLSSPSTGLKSHWVCSDRALLQLRSSKGRPRAQKVSVSSPEGN